MAKKATKKVTKKAVKETSCLDCVTFLAKLEVAEKKIKDLEKEVTEKASKKWRSFKFTGNPNNGSGPTWREFLGYSFKLHGAAQKVKDKDALILEAHAHFTEDGK